MRQSPNLTTASLALYIYTDTNPPQHHSPLSSNFIENLNSPKPTMRPSGAVCDAVCGCPVPCPGGTTCRCARGGSREDDPSMDHKKCSCGEHCGCNPCTCPKSSSITGTGKSNCRCGTGCTCATCAA